MAETSPISTSFCPRNASCIGEMAISNRGNRGAKNGLIWLIENLG